MYANLTSAYREVLLTSTESARSIHRLAFQAVSKADLILVGTFLLDAVMYEDLIVIL